MQASRAELECIFPGNSEMAQRMRAFDWANTSLGPTYCWPQSLKTAIGIILHSRFPMLVWWGQELLSFYNDAYISVHGLRHPSALGLSAKEVWYEIWDQVGPQMHQVLREGTSVKCEQALLIMERNDFTEETYFTYSYSPVFTDDGHIGGILSVCSEDTERVLSQRRLHTLRALSEASVAKTPSEACEIAAAKLAHATHDLPFALLYLLDADGKSASLAGYSGITPDSPAAPGIVMLDSAEAVWPFQPVMSHGTPIVVKDLGQKFETLPNGVWPEAPQQAVILPMAKSGQDELSGFVIAGISPWLALNEDYRDFLNLAATHISTAVANATAYEAEHKRVQALAELDQAKTAFFANISHEFRTPLTLLLSPLDALLADRLGPLGEEVRQEISLVQRNAVRLQKLVNSLLDFSRIEAGRMQANFLPTDLAQLTFELASVFRSAIEKAGMQLTLDCRPLPQPVYVDPGMWEKIVLNLISNAFKYSLQGEISVVLRQEGNTALLTVRDTGSGITADELPKLFSRFYRIKGVRGRSQEGTGIGLAMVRELALLHGGNVSAESTPGKGSAFSVSIPLGHAHLPAEQVVQEGPTVYTSSEAVAFMEEIQQWQDSGIDDEYRYGPVLLQLPKAEIDAAPKVLIADDNADMRNYLQRLLSSDFQVLLAANGRQALEMARQHEPDLVLTDVMMPELDGFELLQALRQHAVTSNTAIILLSARAGEEARIEGLRAGADDYLTKPFSARELLARVRGMVALSRARTRTHWLEQSLRKEAEEMNRLHVLGNRLLASPTLDNALNEVLQAANTVMGTHMGTIQLYDLAENKLQLVAHCGFNEEFLSNFSRIEMDAATTCTKAVRTRRRVMVENIQVDAEYLPHHEIARKSNVFGLQSTPLLNRDGLVIGMLSSYFDQPHLPPERDQHLLDIYARLASDLIERLRTEQALRHSEIQLKRELESMSQLHQLSNRLLVASNLQEAMNEVLMASVVLLSARMGSIQIYDPPNSRLRLLAHTGYRPDFLEFFREFDLAVGTPCSKAVETGERVLVEDMWTDPRFNHLTRTRENGFRGVQSTPLINRDGKVLGVISTHYTEPHLPSEHELRMLDLYIYQAVSLIERLRAEEALRANEAKFRALAEASPALIWQLDAEGNAIYLNERHRTLLGIAPRAMLGKNWRRVLQASNAKEGLAAITQSQIERTAIHSRFEVYDKNGKLVILDTHALPWYGPNGEYSGHVGISVDITDSTQAQRELSISNERLQLAIEGSGDGIWDWDMQSGKVIRSQRFLEILGYEDSNALDSLEAWRKLVHPEDVVRMQSALDACIQNTMPSYVCEYRALCKNGDWKWLLSRGIVVARDASGQALRMTGTISDISEKRRIDETIWQHANFDTLTSLPNRRLFRDRLSQEIRKSQRTNLPMALFFIDLDQFKEVNDLLGHDVGDMLLVEASKRICGCVRQSDTVARLGGDEFTAIITGLEDMKHVESLAQKIVTTLSDPFHLGDEVIYLSASLGITMYPSDANNAERLIRNADQAMYAAKNAGRNQFRYFTRSMQEQAYARLRLIGDLRNALSQNQLRVHYQPVVDLKTGHIAKAEALLRWDHPQFGLIQPPRFIPLAEESGLIHDMGNWIFKEAALRSRQWSEQLGQLFQISVNKSPVQLLAQNGEVNWAQHLESLGMEGSSITMEITESLLLNASASVHNKLLRYRNAGIQIAIDDFGTGYSSMAYLKKFDVDYLKIDQSFIREMTHNAGDLTIVKSVIVMAHELGLKVIAEGIETEEQRQLLVAAGCDYGQGFLFSKPLPAEAFESLLTGHTVYREPLLSTSNVSYRLISERTVPS